ncbi:MAG: YhgE/Pip domain-containing protein [Streptococcaceae bacterium]|nr:YhgE/Pip domain-containing protein [Streptococcaceae bacterium]MCL2680996.1 YhgE/Pip domain-containing protein [Streptococcaceae bacterium]
MLKEEWKAIFKNKFFIVIMLALAIIPALYNWIFLGAMWNPYGKVNQLPVAIVNQDKSAKLNGGTLNLGSQMASQMKSSKDLDYHFVSETEAEKGLNDGKYYMIVTFPEDLSTQASSLMTNHPEKVNIDYQTSQGHNYISSKMSNTAADNLKSKVSESITRNYTQAIFANLSQLKSGMSQAAKGSQQLALGTNSALTGSQQLTNGINLFSDKLSSVKQLTSATQDLSSGLSTLTEKTDLTESQKTQLLQLESGLNQLNDGIQSGSAQIDQVATQLLTLIDSAQGIMDQVKTQVDNVKNTAAFQSLTPAQQQQILAAIQKVESSPQLAQIQALIAQSKNKINDALLQSQKLSNASNLLLPTASTTLDSLSTGMSSVHDALSQQITPGSQKIASGMNQLDIGLTDGTQQLANGSVQLTSGITSLNQGANQLANSLNFAEQKLAGTPTDANNASSIASPLQLNHKDADNVANNGVAMAPYMISVALFVGAMSVNLMIGKSLSGRKWKNGRELLLAKLGTNGVLAIAQSLVVVGAVYLLGLRANFGWKMIFSTVLISLAFMAIVTFFNLWLDKVGAFLMLVFMIVQLAASAGTYPIQLSEKVYQVINPLIPMTYTIKLLREVISLSGNMMPYSFILIGIIILFSILIILVGRREARTI